MRDTSLLLSFPHINTVLHIMAHSDADKLAIVADICERVARGELVTDACASHGIQRSTLHRWSEANEDFRNTYARARVDQAHSFAEQALAIADGRDGEAKNGLEGLLASLVNTPEKEKESIIKSWQSVAVQRDRLRVDTRKWMASKLAGKIYGDKVDVTSAGDKLAAVAVIYAPPEQPV